MPRLYTLCRQPNSERIPARPSPGAAAQCQAAPERSGMETAEAGVDVPVGNGGATYEKQPGC